MRASSPGAIILATGATQRPAETSLHGPAYDLDAALASGLELRGNVCVYTEAKTIGALAVAATLAERGATVTLLSRDPRPGTELDSATYPAVRERLARDRVRVVSDVVLREYRDGQVTVAD